MNRRCSKRSVCRIPNTGLPVRRRVDKWWGTTALEHSRRFMEEKTRPQFPPFRVSRRLPNAEPPRPRDQPRASRSRSRFPDVFLIVYSCIECLPFGLDGLAVEPWTLYSLYCLHCLKTAFDVNASHNGMYYIMDGQFRISAVG